jgi:outer membrane protein OmpA-like peptidoglycan-associated protein
MKKTALIFVLVMANIAPAFSQEDAEGCKDHPLFNRLLNFFIESCQENYDVINFVIDPTGKAETIEGKVTIIRYVFNEESAAKLPSKLQVMRNYENAIVAKGGKKVFVGEPEGGDYSGFFTMKSTDKVYWVAVRDMYEPVGTGVGAFTLVVLEKEPMKQEIQAREMFEALTKTGFIALYINFETGKAEIKPESQHILDQIVQMMKDNPTLKISIEGHTDNVGSAQSNHNLSENRAKAVMSALIAKGIDKARLSSKGWGQTRPIADNTTEEGRAKNRRVEIVKQ